MSKSRQLAAIMFTDIVGYTALMGRDEQKAFEILNRNRQIQKPIIEEHNGRWIKELGDGVMASFNTVYDAVTAAIAIQQICNATNDFKLRIGIHLGEVVFEDGDVFGDGVNLASRIQGNANPGSIFVSESVHTNVHNKRDITTEYVKTERLKNVKDPVKIYQVIADGVVKAKPPALVQQVRVKPKILASAFMLIVILVSGFVILNGLTKQKNDEVDKANEKSIAVLPFTDMSPQKDQEYLSDGLAEEIINSISIIKDLKVIGRTSSFQFKGKKLDTQKIGKNLGVNIVLEGSVQKSGNMIRIFTQLVRVKDNTIIWSQPFEKELKDIFAIQDSIASKIVEKLQLTLTESERPRLTKKETDPEVYSLYLKGRHTYIEQDFQKSIEYNLRAIALDSQFAPSYAYLALAKTWQINKERAFSDFNAIREAKQYANTAIRLDPNIAEGYSALGLISWSIELDFPEAKRNFEISIKLNPSASLIKNRYAYFLLWMADFDKAEGLGRDAIASDPADFNGYVIVAQSAMHKQNFKEAEKYINEGKRLFPESFAFTLHDVSNNFYSGNYDKVIGLMPGINAKSPNVAANIQSLFCMAYFRKGNRSESEKLFRQLKERTKNDFTAFNYSIARVFCDYKQYDSCFYYLEKSQALRETEFRYFKIDPVLKPIRKDPRYQQLYRSYGFDRYSN